LAVSLPAARAQDASAAFNAAADAALAAMKAKAAEQGIQGVAIVAYAPGDAVTGWTSKMIVVGRLTRDPLPSDKDGANFLAIAYSKAGEMAATGEDSGKRKASVPFAGEVRWTGGATLKARTGRVFAAFSGGTGEQDYACSQAGAAVLAKAL
jgi:hypothetical protein